MMTAAAAIVERGFRQIEGSPDIRRRPVSAACIYIAGSCVIVNLVGKPLTLLKQLCGHAMSFGAQAFKTVREEGRQRAFAHIDGARTRIANFEDPGRDAKELRENLSTAAKKSIRTVIDGMVYLLNVRVFESSGKEAFEVNIDPAPKLDPSVTPSFTAKQRQYLAFIYNYMKIHRQAPAESDLERYFQGFRAGDSRYDQDP